MLPEIGSRAGRFETAGRVNDGIFSNPRSERFGHDGCSACANMLSANGGATTSVDRPNEEVVTVD